MKERNYLIYNQIYVFIYVKRFLKFWVCWTMSTVCTKVRHNNISTLGVIGLANLFPNSFCKTGLRKMVQKLKYLPKKHGDGTWGLQKC